MKHPLIFATACLASSLFGIQTNLFNPGRVSLREKMLIEHVQKALTQIESGYRLPADVLQIQGMSTDKGRSFLNLLCKMPGSNYLEIGCFMGGTFVGALFGNEKSITDAVAIDSWADHTRNIFFENCNRFLTPEDQYIVLEQDCFKVDKQAMFPEPMNIYFYDGLHRKIDQEMAFTYFNDILDSSFITIVDDWNWPEVQQGTFDAFHKLGYTVLFEQVLPAPFQGDRSMWWNGMYVAVIRKKGNASTRVLGITAS